MSLAIGVYSWMKFYVPSSEDRETCSSEVAVIVNNYDCDSARNILSMTIENKGRFKVDGFALRASNNVDKQPISDINTSDPGVINSGSLHYIINSLRTGETKTLNFSYGYLNTVKKIEIQPFVNATKTKTILLCERITKVPIENCN